MNKGYNQQTLHGLANFSMNKLQQDTEYYERQVPVAIIPQILWSQATSFGSYNLHFRLWITY